MSKKGLEPSRREPHEPESCASTNSATSTSIFCLVCISSASLFVADVVFDNPLTKQFTGLFCSAECHFDINSLFNLYFFRRLVCGGCCLRQPSHKTIHRIVLFGRVPLRHQFSVQFVFLPPVYLWRMLSSTTLSQNNSQDCFARQSATSTSIFCSICISSAG